MGNINDYSDNEFIALVKELNKKSTYLEKLEFVYSKFKKVKGEDTRQIDGKEYIFTIKPNNNEEALTRWQYFVEQRALEYCKVWLDKNASGMVKAENRTRTIEVLLNDIKDELKGNNDLRWGYKYGIKKTGLDSLNLVSIHTETMMAEIGKGLGLYYAELELNKLQEENKEEEIKEDFPNLDLLTDRQKLTLAKELGLIYYLRMEFDWVNHKKSNLGNLLCLLFGINLNSEKAEAMIKDITKMDSSDGTKSPINSKNLETIRKQLAVLGFNTKDLQKVKK